MSARPLHGKTPWPSGASAEVAYEHPAPRRAVAYTCERGHRFEVTFAATADTPGAWECRCGKRAGLTQPGAGQSEHERRMEQLLGRRTVAELEEILSDRLGEIRGRAS